MVSGGPGSGLRDVLWPPGGGPGGMPRSGAVALLQVGLARHYWAGPRPFGWYRGWGVGTPGCRCLGHLRMCVGVG